MSLWPWVNMLPYTKKPGAVADTRDILIREAERACAFQRGIWIVSYSTVDLSPLPLSPPHPTVTYPSSVYSFLPSLLPSISSKGLLPFRLLGGTGIEQWTRRQSLAWWDSQNRQSDKKDNSRQWWEQWRREAGGKWVEEGDILLRLENWGSPLWEGDTCAKILMKKGASLVNTVERVLRV